jgi:hypothetical protein
MKRTLAAVAVLLGLEAVLWSARECVLRYGEMRWHDGCINRCIEDSPKDGGNFNYIGWCITDCDLAWDEMEVRP